jgi:hypothetical protein
MRWVVVEIWNDGGMQAIDRHSILASRWDTPEQALSSMKYAKSLYPKSKYYVRNIEDGE